MATIIVNDGVGVKGHLTINRTKVLEDVEIVDELTNEVTVKQQVNVIYEGVFECNLYFEEITTLEIPRLKIIGVDVITESFGSDDYLMQYTFTCEDLDFNGNYSKRLEAYSYLADEESRAVEDIMFKEDCPILGGIGPEYSDIIKFNKEDITDPEKEAENE